MKTKIYKSLMLAICTIAFSITAIAQLPNFTRVDTGAISETPGGHVSSACFDIDGDGDLDVLIGNSAVFTQRFFSMYKNERNGYFVKMPEYISDSSYQNLNSFGDVDNDGDADLFAGAIGTNSLRIYSNDGYGNYQLDDSVSLAYPILYPSLVDLNNDSYLDVAAIGKFGSVSYNDGNGKFPVNTDLGLMHEPPAIMLHGMSWGDPDNDGDLDAYGGFSSAGAPFSKNACFLNNGDGTFIKFDDSSVIVDDSTSENASVNWVDYDNDGDMDLYVLNFTLDPVNGPLSALYENLGNMQFVKHVFEDEMYRTSFTNSSVWGDLDNDADLDLFVSIENNPFPWTGDTSATPYNLVFLNDGNGGFENILDHPLTTEDSHTALLFDHDNDGDLDVLMTRYSWSMDGYPTLFVNEGNENSWIVLSCEGTMSNRSAIGTRIYAKSFVNGKHITQTREITPINGHLSYANLRVHFGLRDTDGIDTLIIRWPSGHVDEYLNVEANHFYRAIEDSELGIDFAATSYIKYSPAFADIELTEAGESKTIDLNDYYHFVEGGTLPGKSEDELTFSLYSNENPGVVTATLDENILTIEAGNENGDSKIQLKASAEFTERVDHFSVKMLVNIETHAVKEYLNTYPNPFSTSTTIEYELQQPSTVKLIIYNYLGEQIEIIQQNQSAGKQQVVWAAEGQPSGIYYGVLKTMEGTKTVKMIKMKR